MANHPHELTDTSLDSFLADARLPVLIDLWAPWCVPCRTMAPVIDKLARNTVGKLLVAKIDVEKYPAVMERYAVRGIPTLLLFRDNAEPVRQVGSQSLGQLNSWLGSHQIDVVSQPRVAQSETLEWGSFYGDDLLQAFIGQRIADHAKAGRLSIGLGSFWIEGKGTTSAAMVHQPDTNAFERITGLPIALARLIDRCGYLTADQVSALFAALQAGKDFRLVPLRFMQWWLGASATAWNQHLRDPRLVQLLNQWQALCTARLNGDEVGAEAWSDIGQQVSLLGQNLQQSGRQLEKNIAAMLEQLSPPPATTDDSKWSTIALNINWAEFQLLEIQSGWSDEDRATPDARLAWFMEQERLSPNGKLTQDEISRLREEWQSLNPEFIEKEHAFHQSIEQLARPRSAQWQQTLNRLLADAPDF
ncbi:thioredoxin family protein [Biostraticola tofi]|uniref:Thioredoxin n=1 Tax=Biostraticola tofi TaxID=466109 RepID=A0A4R3YMH8_9GAMM|nr:thioredoxin domain-containing protein [Biostraticola tofi]TCV93526.1 thioredoxin [Biostraticola tofi]